MIGINAVVMDQAVIGESALVAALSYVKPGFVGPPRTVIAGIPAEVKRDLDPIELAWKRDATASYQRLAVRAIETLEEVTPLAEAEANRPRTAAGKLRPLHEVKRGPNTRDP